MKVLRFERFGAPDVLQWQEMPDPLPKPDHAIVRMRAIGLNFSDVYRRQGHYHLAGAAPFIAGYEGAGVVTSYEGDSPFSVGARVGFADSPFANAELVSVPFDKLVPLPDEIDFEVAAAALLQGLTAHYLTRDSHPLGSGETVVIHAAAGGVGLLLVQMARRLGAKVIGLVSDEKKRTAAKDAGADLVCLYRDNWKESVLAATGSAGADVVYDSVGSTLEESLAVTRRGGRVVFFGKAGGNPPVIDPIRLMDNSLTVTGGDLWNVLTSAEERRGRSAELFSWIVDGRLKIRIAGRFPLRAGAAAHAFLESRAAIGKVLLIP